jgi:hypothetical protein
MRYGILSRQSAKRGFGLGTDAGKIAATKDAKDEGEAHETVREIRLSGTSSTKGGCTKE